MQQLIFGVARHEFVVKPLGALYSLHATVPQVHHDFWAQFLVQDLLDLHMSLNATPDSVIHTIKEPEVLNSTQVRVLGYLTHFIPHLHL